MGKKNKEVVRITTSYWVDERGVHIKKSLLSLKKKSYGFQTMNEYCADDCKYEIARIVNLNDVGDGVYVVNVVNVERDWETGIVDAWEYKLVPYEGKIND